MKLLLLLLLPVWIYGQQPIIYDNNIEGKEYKSNLQNPMDEEGNNFHEYLYNEYKEGELIYFGRKFIIPLKYDISQDKLICPYFGWEMELYPQMVQLFVIGEKEFLQFNNHYYERRGEYYIFHHKEIQHLKEVNGRWGDIISAEKLTYFKMINGKLIKTKHGTPHKI